MGGHKERDSAQGEVRGRSFDDDGEEQERDRGGGKKMLIGEGEGDGLLERKFRDRQRDNVKEKMSDRRAGSISKIEQERKKSFSSDI